MRRLSFALLCLVSLDCSSGSPAPLPGPLASGLVVHEWGTYTSVEGSNGATLDGLQHEEEALPDFVRQRAPEVNNGEKGVESLPGPVNQKLETPVLYFYTSTAMDVQVTVDFPGGIISQWFPDAASSLPPVGSMTAIAHGRMTWSAALRPTGDLTAMRPVATDSVWAPSRRVAAVPVGIGAEVEKFIFYRGLGKFDVPFRVESRTDGLLDLVNDSDEEIADAFLLRVDAAGGVARSLGSIPAHGAQRGVSPPEKGTESALDPYVAQTMDLVASALERSGLYHDEARAMVETWSRSYFRGAGLRVLYVTPRAWTDRLLPVAISPAPSGLTRTLVGRVEVMTLDDESQLLANAATSSAATLVSQLGRFAEPKLRRARQLTTDPALVERLDSAIAIAVSSR